jgi:subtilase family serine protease
MKLWESGALAVALTLTACAQGGGTLPLARNGSGLGYSAGVHGTHRATFRAACPAPQPGRFACLALVRTDVWYKSLPSYKRITGIAQSDLQGAASAATYDGLGPAQLQQAYDLPSKTAGKGQTVAVVDAYDDPTAESDLATYRSTFKLPPCSSASGCFRKLNENGAAAPLPPPGTGSNRGWGTEISLDLDMVSAICPNCKIILMEARSSQFLDLAMSVKAAASAGARAISNSYGAPECLGLQGNPACHSTISFAKYFAIPNTIITASSGDSSWLAGPESPADFGTVVAVGGTSLYPYATKRGWVEMAWNMGGGSGCSLFVKRPGWVPASTGCPNSKGKNPGTMRPIADVSAVADPSTGVAVYETFPFAYGGFFIVGGTSASSPIIASV